VVKLVALVLSLFHPSFVPSPNYKPSWPPILSSCLDGMIFIACFDPPLSMMPRCLGTDGCTFINHPFTISLSTHAIPYHSTDQTTAYLIFLLSAATWFGLLVSLHYFNDPLSCLLHIQNFLHCRLFSTAHTRFLSEQHVVFVWLPKFLFSFCRTA